MANICRKGHFNFGGKFEFIKFMFSKKATKIDEIFTVDLTICSKRQIKGEDFVNFRGLLRKYELTQLTSETEMNALMFDAKV